MSDSIAIDYGDCFLRWSDIETVAEGQWLNDAVISFYFELVEASPSLESCSFWQPPAVEILSSLSEEEVGPQMLPLLPLSASDAGCLVLPISDRYGSGHGVGHRATGTHWSLLVVRRGSGSDLYSGVHYDSLRPTRNAAAAKDVLRCLHKVKGHPSSGSDPVFEESQLVPRQVGASDCGLYPLLLADGIARQQQQLMNSDSGNVTEAEAQDILDGGIAHLSPAAVRQFRHDLYDWLLRWARQAQETKDSPARSLEQVEAVIGEMPRYFPWQG